MYASILRSNILSHSSTGDFPTVIVSLTLFKVCVILKTLQVIEAVVITTSPVTLSKTSERQPKEPSGVTGAPSKFH